jgi:7,8-dihydropterin-6-yl-methyl-4-(beta-D-ribofuranosyl)aminobenzene 5'-phosphate synthase
MSSNLVSSYNKKKLAFLDKVDAVSITILVDNYMDILLASSYNVQRPPIINMDDKGLLIPRAEQGFASLVETKYDNSSKTSNFLFEAGVSPEGLLTNANILGLNVADIDGILLSHGHADHYAGLMKSCNIFLGSFICMLIPMPF